MCFYDIISSPNWTVVQRRVCLWVAFLPPSVPFPGTCCSILPHRVFHPPRESLDRRAVSDWLARWDQRSVQTVVSETSSPLQVANIALWLSTSRANTIENISVTINTCAAVNSCQCFCELSEQFDLIWPQWHLWSSICLQLHHKVLGSTTLCIQDSLFGKAVVL